MNYEPVNLEFFYVAKSDGREQGFVWEVRSRAGENSIVCLCDELTKANIIAKTLEDLLNVRIKVN